MGGNQSQIAPQPGATAPGLGGALFVPFEIFNPALMLQDWGVSPQTVTPASLTPATPASTTSHPNILGAVKPGATPANQTLPVVAVGAVPAATATAAANQASTAATTAKQAASAAQQSATAAQQKAQAAQQVAAPNAAAMKQQADAATQHAQQAQQICLNCQQEATKAAQAAQTAATTSGPVAENAAAQAQQAAANATQHAQQTIQHAQTAVAQAAQTGAVAPAAGAAMVPGSTMGSPIVKITPANASAGYLDMSTLGSAFAPLAGGISTAGSPFTQFPQQMVAALSGNPLAQQLATNPAAITPQVTGDPRALTTSYLEWKKRCPFSEYVQARKYFTWKTHCHKHAKNAEKALEDWTSYGKWKEADWKMTKLDIPFLEYVDWKMTAEKEDSDRYREWRHWKNVKAQYKAKFEDVIKKDLKKKKEEYLRFIKKVDNKEWVSFYKFQDWVKGAQMQKLDVNNIEAYDGWKKNYVMDKAAIYQAYKDRKPSEANFYLWLQWMRFEQLREAAADDTDPSSEIVPPWYKRDKNYGRRHRKYWRRHKDDDDANVDYSKEW